MQARTVVVLLVVAVAVAGCATNHMTRGDRKFAKGEYVEAIREYSLVLEEGENADAALRRACAFKIMGHDEAAAGDLVRAAQAGSVEARALLGALRGTADTTVFKKLAVQYPDSPWVWALCGDCFLKAGQAEPAIEAYDQALAKGLTGPMEGTVLYNLTLAHIRAGDTDAAAQRFAEYRTVADSPGGDADHYMAGLLAYARGDHTTAEAEWGALPEDWRTEISAALPGEETLVSMK